MERTKIPEERSTTGVEWKHPGSQGLGFEPSSKRRIGELGDVRWEARGKDVSDKRSRSQKV